MSKSWPFKDPNEVLDYVVNWTPRIEPGDSIQSVTHTVVSGDVVIDDEDFDNAGTTPTDDPDFPIAVNTTVVWLSSGTIGTPQEILSRVVTVGGRTMDQTVKLKIKSK